DDGPLEVLQDGRPRVIAFCGHHLGSGAQGLREGLGGLVVCVDFARSVTKFLGPSRHGWFSYVFLTMMVLTFVCGSVRVVRTNPPRCASFIRRVQFPNCLALTAR